MSVHVSKYASWNIFFFFLPHYFKAEIATHSSILAWKTPWGPESDRTQRWTRTKKTHSVLSVWVFRLLPVFFTTNQEFFILAAQYGCPGPITDQVNRAVLGARPRNQYAGILLGSASQQDWHLPPGWDDAVGSLSGLCREARGCLGEPRVPRFPLNRLLPGMRIPCARLPIPPFSHPSPSQGSPQLGHLARHSILFKKHFLHDFECDASLTLVSCFLFFNRSRVDVQCYICYRCRVSESQVLKVMWFLFILSECFQIFLHILGVLHIQDTKWCTSVRLRFLLFCEVLKGALSV